MDRVAGVWDRCAVVDFESLARRLAGGAQSLGEGARGEARRVLDVLVERGDLSSAEADEIEAAVARAAESQRRWLDETVLAPLGRALRGVAKAAAPAAGNESLSARLAAIEARLEAIERALRHDEPKS
jgi:polyhydroxyalkanoate synthesis regulator phasin